MSAPGRHLTPDDVAGLLREARSSVRAPDGLRMRVEAERPRPRRHRAQRLRLSGALAGGLAAVILALALLLPSGTPGGPSLSQAAALALRGPAMAAPGSAGRRLSANVGEVYFPDWGRHLGWRAVGERTDRIGGRLAITVFYAQGRHTVAYTVVAAPALAQPQAQDTVVRGITMRTLRLYGRTVVTWRRAGQTCVLSGARVPARELRTLAAWEAPAA